MEDDDRLVEAEQALLERQTASTIAGIRASLEEEGEDDCIACGEPIDVARRLALPSAFRCVGCQALAERGGNL